MGKGVKVWAGCQIRENANIGNNTTLGKGVYVGINVQVGRNCKIQNYANLFCGVTIDDDVFIGPNACFTNDKTPRAFNVNWKITETKVMQGSSIGANATIVCGVTIGKYAIVGAGSVVTRDVEDYSVVVGNPARHIHYVDIMGNKQCEKTQQEICEIN